MEKCSVHLRGHTRGHIYDPTDETVDRTKQTYYNTRIFQKEVRINFSRDICFNKIIHPPPLCEEKRVIIAQLNNILLEKCGLYTIDGFTMSNIDTFIDLLATE